MRNTVGGSSEELGCYISGNGNDGIIITGDASKHNKIRNNFIGPRVDLENNPGNGANGIIIEEGASENLIRDNQKSD